jgi:hypothetical protein
MTSRSYQAALARLVTQPGLLDDGSRVSVEPGPVAPAAELSPLERRRLAQVASNPGLRITALLISSFRLAKLVTLLPLTRALLGADLLASEADRYWTVEPPTSFYLLEEALAFCDHLLARQAVLDVVFLDEVVGYERAMLRLRRVQGTDERPEPEVIRFTHDPRSVLPTLAAGLRPDKAPELVCSFIGTMDGDGEIDWRPLLDPAPRSQSVGPTSPISATRS